MDYNHYRQAVRKKVCEHCIELAENGHCTLTGDEQCGVELYLEKIVDVVHTVKSRNLDNYVNELRKQVCGFCKNQNSDGSCRLRNEVDCGLDRYFALAIEAIEEADEQDA